MLVDIAIEAGRELRTVDPGEVIAAFSMSLKEPRGSVLSVAR